MGLIRVELMTPSLSEKCSNRLSYSPKIKYIKKRERKNGSKVCFLVVHQPVYLSLRKEVIQPHLPVRLPCYDFTPLTKRTFDSVLPYGLDYRLRVPSTRMVWRAVCTRPGNVFTASCWYAITSDSNFMKSGFRLQSELRLLFCVLLHITVSLHSVSTIVARV